MLAVTREAYGEDEGEVDETVGIAIPATMGMLGLAFIGCALVIAGLPPLSGFIAKFALLTAALNPHHRGARSCPARLMGFACRADLVRNGGAYCDDPRGYSRVLGVAGPRRAARAADRNRSRRRASNPLRNADDPGRPGHALHAGYSAIAACPRTLHPRRPWSGSGAPAATGEGHMTRLLPFPLASAGLLALWLRSTRRFRWVTFFSAPS